MSVMGKLHIHGRLRRTLGSEHNEETSAPVHEQCRGKTTMSEYMAQCNYKEAFAQNILCDCTIDIS